MHRLFRDASDFEEGLFLGILIGEGHFGGDGKQPQITLRMHVAHQSLFHWIQRTFPGGRLYGPYRHGDREYYQWMARGRFLREEMVPFLDRRLTWDIDQKTYLRFTKMKIRYGLATGPPAPSSAGP